MSKYHIVENHMSRLNYEINRFVFSESSMSQIYFVITSILKNQSSKFGGFRELSVSTSCSLVHIEKSTPYDLQVNMKPTSPSNYTPDHSGGMVGRIRESN